MMTLNPPLMTTLPNPRNPRPPERSLPPRNLLLRSLHHQERLPAWPKSRRRLRTTSLTNRSSSGSALRSSYPYDYVAVNTACLYSWAAARAAKSAGPAAPGSKAVPEPRTDDCLAGLAFVFTGELSAFSREEATELAKRFGGCVVRIQCEGS